MLQELLVFNSQPKESSHLMYSALTTEPQWIYLKAIYDFGYAFMDYYFTKTFKCLDTKSFKCLEYIQILVEWIELVFYSTSHKLCQRYQHGSFHNIRVKSIEVKKNVAIWRFWYAYMSLKLINFLLMWLQIYVKLIIIRVERFLKELWYINVDI